MQGHLTAWFHPALSLLLGVLGLFAGAVLWLVLGRPAAALWTFLGAGGLSALMCVLPRWRGRPAHSCRRILVKSIAFVGLLVLVTVLAFRHPARWDLTRARAYSLSPQTIAVLKSLKEPVSVTAFFLSDDRRREPLEDLLEEYRFYTDKVAVQFIDPEVRPAAAKQYGITSYGVVVLEQGDKRQDTFALHEKGLTAALLRLAQEKPLTVSFITGHRERDPFSEGDEGYATLRAILERRNYAVRTLNLTASSDVAPSDEGVLVLADPREEFSVRERDILRAYLYHGGRVLWLLDVNGALADPSILADWGVRPRDDLVIEPQNAFLGEIASPILVRYPPHPITEEMGGLVTIFPSSRSLELIRPAISGVAVSPIVETSKESWGETQMGAELTGAFKEGEDIAGPLVLGAAAQESMHGGRLVLIGDADFVSNGVLSSLGEAFGNAGLFISAVNWLAEDEAMAAVPPHKPAAPPVILTRRQMRLIFYSTTLLLPLSVLVAGVAVWWSNRS